MSTTKQPYTYTSECHSCEGKGGWTDYGRGWDCYSGPEPDEWVPCEHCQGSGQLTHTVAQKPATPPRPARPASIPVIDECDLVCEFDDSDPFGDNG